METETEQLPGDKRLTFIDECNQTLIDAKVDHRLDFTNWEICYVKLNSKRELRVHIFIHFKFIELHLTLFLSKIIVNLNFYFN